MAVATIATIVVPCAATMPSLVLPPPSDVSNERATSPSPETALKPTGNFELYAEMNDDGTFWITSTITFSVDAWYSHTIPVAPAGSSVDPPPLRPTASGSPDVPSADETVLPEGHDDDAVVVVIVGAAVGGAVAFGADAVGVAAELEFELGVELPQAARVAAAARVANGNKSDLLRVTFDASVIGSKLKPPAGAL